jgi:hypothetical protein
MPYPGRLIGCGIDQPARGCSLLDSCMTAVNPSFNAGDQDGPSPARGLTEPQVRGNPLTVRDEAVTFLAPRLRSAS